MNFGTLNISLIDVSLYVALFIAAVLAVAMILKLTADHQQLEFLRKRKVQNKHLVEFICHELDKITQHMDNLLNDMNVVHIYNINHVQKLETSLKYFMTSYDYIETIDNLDLKQKILYNLHFCENLTKEIAAIEKSSYDIRLKHQEIISALNKKHHVESIRDEEYIEKLNSANANVKSLLKSYNDMRERSYENIKVYTAETAVLKEQLLEYKQKSIEQKKFYPRYVAFI